MITKLGRPDHGTHAHAALHCATHLPDCPDDPGAMAMCPCGRVWTATLMLGRRMVWYREAPAWAEAS